MPGVSIARRREGLPTEEIERALDAVCFFEDYEAERLLSGTDLSAAVTGYDSYPTRHVETPEAVVLLEGHLYDVEGDDVRSHLRDVGEWVRREATAELSRWVGDRDGDFVVYVIEKDTGDVWIVTDPLGRLPLYHSTADGVTVLSRELKFVRELARRVDDPVAIDDLAVAQTLLFGYRLGTRTLFSDVERVPPGSLFHVGHDDQGREDVTVERLHRFDFGETANTGRSVADNARELATRFEAACRRRAAIDGRTVVALSGGLDSRAVAAGLDAVDADFTAATFDREDGSTTGEVRGARAVAEALDLEWSAHVVSGSEARRETLLETKQGMNELRLSFLLDFFDRIDARRGATYVTGDGGDKAFPDHSPPGTFAAIDDLVRFVVASNRVFEPAEAAAIAGVSEEALLETVRERVASYPETGLEARYVHFLVRERGMNWLAHGEDRNRYYYWSVSPFYSLPFFEYAMDCPVGQKRGKRLYRAFLSELSPAVLDVEDANFGAPLTSMEYRAKQFCYDALSRYPGLRSRAIALLRRVEDGDADPAPDVARWIREQVARNRAVRRSLSAADVDRVARCPESYTVPALYHLFTVTSIVDRCSDGDVDGEGDEDGNRGRGRNRDEDGNRGRGRDRDEDRNRGRKRHRNRNRDEDGDVEADVGVEGGVDVVDWL